MNSKRKGISNLNSNVFYCLSKYPPNAKRDPEENFFTEALAFVLKNDKEFYSNFLEEFLARDFEEELRIGAAPKFNIYESYYGSGMSIYTT